MRQHTLVVIGSLVILGSLARAVVPQPVPSAEAESQGLSVQTLVLPEAETGYSVSRAFSGEVQARRQSDLGFERGGELTEIMATEGMTVAAGAPLARLDTRALLSERQGILAQIAAATAQLAELEAGPRSETIAVATASVQDLQNQLDLAAASYQRWQALYDEGAITQQQLDESAAQLGSLEARLVAAQQTEQELQVGSRPEQMQAQAARVASLEAALASLDVALAKSEIRAPYAGQIAARHSDEGTVVAAGQPVLRLVETGIWEARIGVPVHQTRRLGDAPEVEIEGQLYAAEVEAIAPEVDPISRTVTVLLRLEAATLISGQTARLHLTETINETGYWLPQTALVPASRGLWRVYSVAANQQVNPQVVEVVHSEAERVFVRGTLQAGDRIIVAGTQRLVPGQQVSLQGAL